jgi:hypothetical protein
VRIHGGWIRRLALSAGILWAATGHAQAWLPDGGTTSFGVSYTDTLDKKHTTAGGQEVDVGHIRTLIYGFAAAYSSTDRLMFAASLPLVRSRYYGPDPHPTTTDDGDYHTTFTDLRTEVHYQLLLNDVWALAPYAAYVLPTHTYSTLGHAAPGRGLDELWLGLSAGASLDKIIPRAYMSATFTYAVVQHVVGISHDKEDIDGSIGWFATPSVSVQAFVNWQKTLGGFYFYAPPNPADPIFPHHDQLAAAGYTNVGIGSSWDFSDRSTISLAYSEALHGVNTHLVDHSVSLIYSYGFFGFRPHS